MSPIRDAVVIDSLAATCEIDFGLGSLAIAAWISLAIGLSL